MIDFRGLLNIASATEATSESQFDMGEWGVQRECGTTHCMVGCFCVANPKDELRLHFDEDYDVAELVYQSSNTSSEISATNAISARFGITEKEACWLFTYHPRFGKERTPSAIFLTKQQALTRLRKFIYYKLKKQEMTYDVARNLSGNHAAALAVRND